MFSAYVFYLPKKLASWPPSSGAGQHQGPRESLLCESLAYIIDGLLCPMAHKGVKSCHGDFREAPELYRAAWLGQSGSFTFYLSPWRFHQGHWHNGARETEEREPCEQFEQFIRSPYLVAWVGLAQGQNERCKSSFAGEDARRGQGKGANDFESSILLLRQNNCKKCLLFLFLLKEIVCFQPPFLMAEFKPGTLRKEMEITNSGKT